MSNAKTAGNGMGCGTVLFFIFLVLKLTHYIDWSWWWVTSPIWIPGAIVLGGFILFGLGLLFFNKR